VPSVVVDGEFAAAGPAAGQALQQRAAVPNGAGAGLVCGGAGVLADPLLVGQVVIPVQEPLVVVGDAHLPDPGDPAIRRSANGLPSIRVSTCTSRQHIPAGSTRLKGGSAALRNNSSGAATTAPSKRSRPTSATGSSDGTTIRNPSSGRRPPSRSSARSEDLCDESKAQHTSRSRPALRVRASCGSRRSPRGWFAGRRQLSARRTRRGRPACRPL